jgi:hypothetical protein
MPSLDAEIEEYLALPDAARVDWAEMKMRDIWSGHKMGLGNEIERRYDLMERLFQVEESEEVKRQLQPMLDDARKEWDEMWRDIAAENP